MKTIILLSSLLFSFFSTSYAAEVFIGVNGGITSQAITLRIMDFAAQDETVKNEDFQNTVRSDLYMSRYFEIKESDGTNLKHSDSNQNNADAPDFSKADSQYILTGFFGKPEKEDRWIFTGTIYDVKSRKAILRKKYKGETKALRRSAHLFADAVTEALTGKPGIAHSRIAFSNDATGKKEIYVADYDGANLKKITSDKSINLLPRWSKDSSRIYYTTYRYGNPDMFEINFKEGKIQPFSTYQGLNIPGNISPDGLTMVMTASRGGDPNIYTLNIVTKAMKPLLERKYGITSSPTWSPDGKEVAFVSDRSGNPQIHVLNMETKKIRRLTRMNWCDSPMWSPDGSKILFSGRESTKEKFNIFVSDLTGSNIVRLTVKAGTNENPVWSPDGRFIAFTSTRNGRKQIFVMDADGSAQHVLNNIPGNSYTPSWSN